jgi:hypothetical protein
MPWMETGAGHVELLIGLDNRQWLPAHVEDSWDPDDDMRLMRSVFGHRYMIPMDGGETSFSQTMPQTTRQALRGAQSSRRMQLKRFSCLSTGGGARAHGILGRMGDWALPVRGEDAWGRAPKPAG